MDDHDEKTRDLALTEYTRALSHGDNASYLGERASVLRRLNRNAEARDDYDRALAINPWNADLYRYRAMVRARLGDVTGAKADVEALRRVWPFDGLGEAALNMSAYHVLYAGYEAYTAKRYDEAVAKFNEALAIDPNYADAYYRRGLAYGWMQRLDEAAADFRKALSLKSGHADALVNLVWACGRRGLFAEARAACDQFLKENPGHAVALAQRARVLHELGLEKDALRDLNQACLLGDAESCARLKR